MNAFLYADELKPADILRRDRGLYVFSLGELESRRRSWDDAEHNYGVYFLFQGSDLKYVGQARDIINRLVQHRYPNAPSLTQADWFDTVSTVEIENEMFWSPVECYYIHTFKPPHNLKYPLRHGLAQVLF